MKKQLFIYFKALVDTGSGVLVFAKDVIHSLYQLKNIGFSLCFIIDENVDKSALHILENDGINFFVTKEVSDYNDVYVISKSGTAYNIYYNSLDVLKVESWNEIVKYFKTSMRKMSHSRKTNETSIELELNPDGSGIYSISTGLGFFNHMLEQFSKHSLIDLNISVKGDLHIDEHHTIEDTAIALGEAIAKALGDKKGMERYGFALPMDDCLAQVAIDFGGRNWLVWDVEFKREKIGDVPTEMFYHFFKSFSDAAKCNLNIKAEGINEHHKIESIFKAFAKAVKMAVAVNYESDVLPTTKGLL